jgi:electron transfer flavoprotein alpha subunit
LTEHRRGELREITFEMLSLGRRIAEKVGAELTAILLGHETGNFAEELTNHAARVLVVDDERLKNPNPEAYQRVLSHLIAEHKPLLTFIGHTAFGMDLAPGLAADINVPLATDCVGLDLNGGKLFVIRQMYGGKVNVEASLCESESYVVTIRPATFEVDEAEPLGGEVVEISYPLERDIDRRKFLRFIEPPVGEVDIASADVIISIGRGIEDSENIQPIQELVDVFEGALACSRPIVDKGWLTNDRQVGVSGKTVKPKLYIALGISGAFQHLVGMKNSDLIIAVNKDSKAPIFNVSDYGIVGDLFKVVPALKEKLTTLKKTIG